MCAFTTAVITTYAVPQLTAADGLNLGAKTYLVFGGCTAIITVFVSLTSMPRAVLANMILKVYFFLPETAK
jgi:hypothetical protein